MKLCLIPLLAAATLGSNSYAQEAQLPIASLTWQSKSSNDHDLALEFEDLYLSLYNSGNLVVQTHELGDLPTAEFAMRSEGQFYGPSLPVELDAMLCDLNPEHCRRTLIQFEGDLSDSTAHVGGYEISEGQWNTGKGDTIILPDYEFQQVTALERVPTDSKWSPDQVELPEAINCSSWGLTCTELVKELNPPSTHSGAPAAVLPFLQLQTILPLRGDEGSQMAGQLSRYTGHDNEEVIFATPKVANAADLLNSGEIRSFSDIAIDNLKTNLSTIGIIEAYESEDDPLFSHQIDLFKLVNHPFATKETFEEGYLAPVIVAIMDGALNIPHCDLPPLELPDGSILQPAATESIGRMASLDDVLPPRLCSEIDELALDESQHSASVIGVIASPQNGMGIVGMNPYAEFHFIPFDNDRAPNNNDAKTVVEQLQRGLKLSVRVANLSFGVMPIFNGKDDFLDVLQSRSKRTLFVAAAGNHNHDLDRECRVLPACLNHLDNVITVVGIDNNLTEPHVWSDGDGAAGSNTHSRFEIAAPALSVLSTVSGHKFVHKSGTSFAAPQVTAAASLLFARAESFWADDDKVIPQGGQIPPKVVKDRLVYTTDYFPSLKGKVLGGRLNIKRALDVEWAQFELFGRDIPIAGIVIEAPQFIQCNDGGAVRQLNFWNIRRITFDEERGSHIIFSHTTTDTAGDRGGELYRDPSCVMATLAPIVNVRTRVDGNFVDEVFSISDIKDYTSPMYPR